MEKASRAIRAAEILLRESEPDFAAGRAYYAMFYVAEALLYEKELQFRKHSGVHSAFGEHFAKTGLFDSKFHRWLLDASDRRIQADYGVDVVLASEDVELVLQQAREFMAEARRLLKDTRGASS
ncbi:MAG: HEPN domain-containing protein [Vicinamibacteria bacterium]